MMMPSKSSRASVLQMPQHLALDAQWSTPGGRVCFGMVPAAGLGMEQELRKW